MIVLVIVLVALGVVGLVGGLVRLRGHDEVLTWDAALVAEQRDSTRIMVNGEEYGRVEDVPDPEIRAQLQRAIEGAHRERGAGPTIPSEPPAIRSKTRVMVGGRQYDSVDAVPDLEIRAQLHRAIEDARRDL
ncbi:MAG: hypothetical protein ACT4OX_00830 [Actinomycetota bacterium]